MGVLFALATKKNRVKRDFYTFTFEKNSRVVYHLSYYYSVSSFLHQNELLFVHHHEQQRRNLTIGER